LRVGDDVLVHDPWGNDFTLSRGVVAFIDSRKGANSVGMRVRNGDAILVLWPPYLAVHRDPIDPTEPCWRCEALARASSRPLDTSSHAAGDLVDRHPPIESASRRIA
jgi:hypothetical protein